MSKLTVKKSIIVQALPDQIFPKINDFHHWTSWSPWLIMEPETKVSVDADGKYYSWEGKITGSGNMKITGEATNKSIDIDLNFIKPWKSSSKVRFELNPVQNGTEVIWLMDNRLPFFMFFMKKMMETFIGMDFDRGLGMLKDLAEKGEVQSQLDFKGTSKFSGFKYIGVKTTCKMDEVGEKMNRDFTQIDQFFKDKNDLLIGPFFSIYHKYDPVKDKVIYTSAAPITHFPAEIPDNMVIGEIPKTEVFTIKHKGPYQHLSNAWSTLFMMQRNKAFKADKSIPPFETYLNMPGEVPDKDLITEVHFAIK